MSDRNADFGKTVKYQRERRNSGGEDGRKKGRKEELREGKQGVKKEIRE